MSEKRHCLTCKWEPGWLKTTTPRPPFEPCERGMCKERPGILWVERHGDEVKQVWAMSLCWGPKHQTEIMRDCPAWEPKEGA